MLGLGIGLVVGAGGMYLTLRPPWGGRGAPAPSDAGIVAVAPHDAGTAKPKPRRRPGRGGTVAAPAGGDADETEPPPLTDADRKLEWRGDAVAKPPRTIDMSAGDEARPLDDGEIGSVLSSQTGGVRDCVVQAATNTDLRATISIELYVDGSGRVTKSRMQAPRYLFEHGLLGCAQRSLGRLKFPATGAPTFVSFPVNLG